MASEGNCAKVCTFICFNIFYLLCVGVYIFKLVTGYAAKNLADFDLPPSHGTMLTLVTLVVVLMIFIAVFGFVAYCVDKPVLYIAYAVMLLVCMVLQIWMSVVGDKAMFETIEYQIKYDELPKFKDIQYSFKVAIQDAQQENSCCGVSSYKDYYDSSNSDLEQNSRIPDSCCGKYKYSSDMGSCTFEEYSKKEGCGSLLRDAYLDVFEKSGLQIKAGLKATWAFFIIFCIIQVFAALLAFAAFLQTRAQASNTGMIYGGAATTYR